MATATGPDGVQRGLIFCVDGGNPKSFKSGDTEWKNIAPTSFPNMKPASGFNSQCQWNPNGYFDINSKTDNPQANAIANSTNNAHIYHTVPTEFRLDGSSQDKSYEAWFRITNLSNTNGPIFRTMTGIGCSYACNGGIEYNSGVVEFTHYDNSAYHLTNGGYVATPGVWIHAVGSYTSGENPNKKLYINGELNASMNTSAFDYASGGVYIEIGFNRKTNAPRTFDGDIAIVSMYNVGLTAAEVKQNFNANRARFGI